MKNALSLRPWQHGQRNNYYFPKSFGVHLIFMEENNYEKFQEMQEFE